MTRQASTNRSIIGLQNAAKLPAFAAWVVLCLWPAWMRPCCCAIVSTTSPVSATVDNADQCEPCELPACCQTKRIASRSTVSTETDATSPCVCCDQNKCPCETRVESIERLTTNSSHTHELVEHADPPIQWIGSSLTMQVLPTQVPHRLLARVDCLGAIYTAADHCAVLCRWLN